MDTSDPEIRFDGEGICNHCRAAHLVLADIRRGWSVSGETLATLAERIKSAAEGHTYDSIIGLSGGVDSSYVAHLARQHGLRPLAVHFDNGWNAELAVENIQRLVDACGFDLETYVVNWQEFRDLQRSFFKASVVDIEIVTDHGIFAALIALAEQHGIRYILSGTNKATEYGIPDAWAWNKHDWTNISAIHREFGAVPLRTFPHITFRRWLAIRALPFGLRIVEPLNLVPYRRDEAAATLAGEYGWREYGGKHHESIFTRFYQGYVLPTKFGIDKRRAHLSARIRNGEISRDEALKALDQPVYTPEDLAVERAFVLKKLGFTNAEFDEIMRTPPKPHDAYPSDRRAFDIARKSYRKFRGIRIRRRGDAA
jgi:N-acetyl sugar amidotransferase